MKLGKLLILSRECADRIVLEYLAELEIDDRRNSVLQAKACEHERRTAADAEHCHENSVLVAENVSRSDLCHKAEALPDERDAFENDSLSALRSFWTHELCRLDS